MEISIIVMMDIYSTKIMHVKTVVTKQMLSLSNADSTSTD